MKRAVLPPLLTFQFTHPGRGATREVVVIISQSNVSIHAPREGCDHLNYELCLWYFLVSIHAPREGCDSVVQSCVLWGG